MTINDLVNAKDFDCNCKYAIFQGNWHENKCLYSSYRVDGLKSFSETLKEKIKYITIDTKTNTLVIEVK